jgi:nucleotide-binding universal stress UspA family protein
MFDRGPQNLIGSGSREPTLNTERPSGTEPRAGRPRRLHTNSSDRSSQVEIRDRLVVGVDGSVGSQHALDWSADIARRVGAGIELVHASSPWVGLELALPPFDYDGYRAAVSRSVDGWAARLTGVDHHSTVIEDDASHAILAAASEIHPTLIVLGAHPDGSVVPRKLGSTISKVLGGAEAPVVIVPSFGGPPSDGARVVVGVDGSDSSLGALRWAAGWAANLDLGVYAVWVIPVGPYHEKLRLFETDGVPDESEALPTLRALADRVERESGADITSDVLIGQPGAQLVDAARDGEMLVIGSSRHGMLHALARGSTSRVCVTRCAVPTVVVR